jgi:hypothetical protein
MYAEIVKLPSTKVLIFSVHLRKLGMPCHRIQVASRQGDQIGRIFAFGAIVYFGQIFEKLQK